MARTAAVTAQQPAPEIAGAARQDVQERWLLEVGKLCGAGQQSAPGDGLPTPQLRLAGAPAARDSGFRTAEMCPSTP